MQRSLPEHQPVLPIQHTSIEVVNADQPINATMLSNPCTLPSKHVSQVLELDEQRI